jgi:hypothetical protein
MDRRLADLVSGGAPRLSVPETVAHTRVRIDALLPFVLADPISRSLSSLARRVSGRMKSCPVARWALRCWCCRRLAGADGHLSEAGHDAEGVLVSGHVAGVVQVVFDLPVVAQVGGDLRASARSGARLVIARRAMTLFFRVPLVT